MREVFYFVATVVLIVAVFAPEQAGMWLQYVDAARYGCDTMPCWDESITH
jgi:hypothetical protein